MAAGDIRWTCQMTRHFGVPLTWAERHDSHCECDDGEKRRLAVLWDEDRVSSGGSR